MDRDIGYNEFVSGGILGYIVTWKRGALHIKMKTVSLSVKNL